MAAQNYMIIIHLQIETYSNITLTMCKHKQLQTPEVSTTVVSVIELLLARWNFGRTYNFSMFHIFHILDRRAKRPKIDRGMRFRTRTTVGDSGARFDFVLIRARFPVIIKNKTLEVSQVQNVVNSPSIYIICLLT